MRSKLAALRGLAPLLALFISACGGGGGGGGSSPSTPAPVPPVTPVPPPAPSLIPAAPPVGEVLLLDAQRLRPLQAGAVRNYAGTESLLDPSGVRIGTDRGFLNTVTQAQGAGQLMLESSSNALNGGPDVMELSASSQSTQGSSPWRLSNGMPALSVPNFQLRSPVRANEQYTLADMDVPDLGADFDGDGKNESARLAVYALVVGWETTELKRFGALKALRVDTTTRLRVLPSKAGLPDIPVIEVRQKAWYVPGIGLVRQWSDLPSDVAQHRKVFDEQLVYYTNGLANAGFGVAKSGQQMRVPDDSSLEPGTALNFLDGGPYGFKSGAVALIRSLGATITQGLLVASLNDKGQVRRVQELPQVSKVPLSMGHAKGVTLLSNTNESTRLHLFNLDPEGRLITTGSPPLIGLSGNRLNPYVQQRLGVVSGNTLWLVWVRGSMRSWTSRGFINELVLRPFDAFSATPLGEELILETSDQTIPEPLQIVATKERPFVTWRSKASTEQAYSEIRLAGLSSSEARPVIRTLFQEQRVDIRYDFSLHALESSVVLGFRRLPDSSNLTDTYAPGFVHLDETGAPILPAGIALLDALLPKSMSDVGFRVAGSAGNLLVLVGTGSVNSSADSDPNASPHPFQEIRLLRSDGKSFPESDLQVFRHTEGAVDQVLFFEKHLLLIQGSNGIYGRVLWLP